MSLKGSTATAQSEPITTLIPARVDRMHWSRFQTRMVMALGIAWILDGLEITIASDVADLLTHKNPPNAPGDARHRQRVVPENGAVVDLHESTTSPLGVYVSERVSLPLRSLSVVSGPVGGS